MRAVVFAFLIGLAMETSAQTENFDSTATGALPNGWKAGVTGSGSANWAVTPDSSAPSPPNVIVQKAKGAFPWAVREGVAITDGFVEVKFKAISGKEDQAGGLMWRWKDGSNYYVARANALENNVSLYYTTNGRRNTIKYVNAPVPLNTWHTLRVDFAGNTIRVSLNGKTYIEEKDSHIAGSGAVGLWTKADSVTAFDDFSYGAAKLR
jgi:hypothetical protein